MLQATAEERKAVFDYFNWQAPDLKVTFAQKVYDESVLSHVHSVWDIHTDKDRWWVITNPTNLYSQEQFPNLDLALTFHIGLCIRIPKTGEQKRSLAEMPIEPFAECYRILTEASDALSHADEVSDFQAIGVKAREALLGFVAAGQIVVPWGKPEPAPQKANFKGWAEHLCNVILGGDGQKDRRQLMKSQLDSAWSFANWLTHAKRSDWYDAEAAVEITDNAIGLGTSMVLRHIKGVPDKCPACGSHHLTPQRGERTDMPGRVWERSACTKCGWTGQPVQIVNVPTPPDQNDRKAPEGECIIPTIPLRELKKPDRVARLSVEKIAHPPSERTAAKKQVRKVAAKTAKRIPVRGKARSKRTPTKGKQR